MKLFKYFFVMAFLASVGGVSAFAQLATGESNPDCPAGASGSASEDAEVVVGGAAEGSRSGSTEPNPTGR